MANPFRDRVEQRSMGPLTRLRTMPVWITLAVVLALTLGGLMGHGWVSGVLLGALALITGWLTYLGWPTLTLGGRLLRSGVVLLIVVVAVARAAA